MKRNKYVTDNYQKKVMLLGKGKRRRSWVKMVFDISFRNCFHLQIEERDKKIQSSKLCLYSHLATKADVCICICRIKCLTFPN